MRRKVEQMETLTARIFVCASEHPESISQTDRLFKYYFPSVLKPVSYTHLLGRSMQEIFKMLPYLVTIIVLIITSLRKKKEQQPPESLGLAYFREDR